jgi:hypothetical protein
MPKRSQAASQAAKENKKPSEMTKAVEGLWSALLQGSASGMVESAATQTGHAR